MPLILAGWIATNDLEKAQRWQETVTWARDRDLERILADLREQDKYCVEEFTTYEVGPFGGPMYLTWNFDAKPVPDARSVQMAMAILLKEWPTIVGWDLGRMTKPLGFTARRSGGWWSRRMRSKCRHGEAGIASLPARIGEHSLADGPQSTKRFRR